MKRDPRLHGLSSEHHRALVLARRLSKLDAWSPADGERLREQLDRELEPHFGAEEDVLLPALRAVGEVAVADRTLADHVAIRAHVVAAAAGGLEAAREVGARLAEHVRFEERELFPICEARLPSSVLDEVGRRRPHDGTTDEVTHE